MDVKQALEEIKTRPLVPLWPHLGLVLDMSRGSVYEAVRKGQIDVLRYGKNNCRMKALTAPLRRKLELGDPQ
jgi:hypothetical protein